MELQTTQDCIDYCIKILDENPDEQCVFLEGTNVGEEMVLVYRGKPCECDDKPFYEIRVATVTKMLFKDSVGFIEHSGKA